MGILQDPNMGNKDQQMVNMFFHQTSLNRKAEETSQRIELQQSGPVESIDEGTVCRLESKVHKLPSPLSPLSKELHFPVPLIC